MPKLDQEYIKSGKLRYVVRDFPLAGLHPQAFKGHEAARCALDQGKFWPMHARLFANQKAMSPADLQAHAQALGLDQAAFNQCLSQEKQAAAVRRDLEEGAQAGVTGTPTFFLALVDPKEPGKVKSARVLTGAQPYERFKEAIDSLLQQASRPAQ